MFGKVMLKDDLEAGKRKYKINVSELPEGVYVLGIVIEGKIYRQKLVVMQ